jgi:hypothetical protein
VALEPEGVHLRLGHLCSSAVKSIEDDGD